MTLPLAERADARANRQRLLDAALVLLAEYGPDVEIKAIAERAGLGVGTVYRHFASKEDLVAALVGQAVAAFDRLIEEALSCQEPDAGLRHLLRGGLTVVDRYGVLMTAMLAGWMPHIMQTKLSAERRASHRASLGTLIERGQATGVVRHDVDPQVVVALLGAMFSPTTVVDLRRGRAATEIADAFLDVLLRGVGSA